MTRLSPKEPLFPQGKNEYCQFSCYMTNYNGAPDKPCGVGRADANPKLLLNDT